MDSNPSIQKLLSEVNVKRLKEYTKTIEGLRHGGENYEALEERAGFIEETLRSLDLKIENQSFDFHGKTYRNIIATQYGSNEKASMILVGAHYDAAMGSPGADDNASGVAVMLEAATVLSRYHYDNAIQFVAFTLEEPQIHTIQFLIGSDHFAEEAIKRKMNYRAVLILESVGYTDDTEGSQISPLFVKVPVPKTGNFLGVVADRKSRNIMNIFSDTAAHFVPELPVVTYKVPFSGRIIPETRFSDHASFWNRGYPALMLTDTAMFRNPHYHTYRDRSDTLDFHFMTGVTKAVISVTIQLGTNSEPGTRAFE